MPDVRAYAKSLGDLRACADAACADAAIDRALSIWPDSPWANLLKGRRLADPAEAVSFARKALEVISRDERIAALELAGAALEKVGDRDAAVSAYAERLALGSKLALERHVERLSGKPLAIVRDPSFRLGGPLPSIDFYCQALAAENPSQYGGTHCLPGCAGVDEGPAKASGGGWKAELVATIEESDAVAGSKVSCDLAIGNASGWYVLREAATCAPCGHAPFPERTPLLEIYADPELKGRGNHDGAPRHDAAISEQLEFRDVVPGGAPELVWRMRSRTISVSAWDADRSVISRDDDRVVVVCGLGASGRWSCLPAQHVSHDQESAFVVGDGPSIERTTWQQTLKLEDGRLELIGAPEHARSIQLVFP